MLVEFQFSDALMTRLTQEEQSRYCTLLMTVMQAGEDAMPFFGETGEGEVFVSFVDDEEMHRINWEQRNVDRTTDVLSFPLLDFVEGEGAVCEEDYNPESNKLYLGDLVISLDTMKAQAEEYGHKEERELGFLACHGFLHLMGYDHMEPEEEARMMALTEKILATVNLGRDE